MGMKQLPKMGGGTDVEDIVQEAFVPVIERPPSAAPRAYIYRTVLNLLVDRGRLRHAHSVSELIDLLDTERNAVRPCHAPRW